MDCQLSRAKLSAISFFFLGVLALKGFFMQSFLCAHFLFLVEAQTACYHP
jgi:hypothetical protein